MAEHPALRVENLRFRYPRSREWAIDVSRLELDRGEQMLVASPSGGGKSTLLHLIAGLIDPTEGTVEVDGRDVHAMGGARRDLFRGAAIGMIFQTFNLLPGFSALENVEAALLFSPIPTRRHRQRASDLLGRLGIERPEARPDELSVGQQQRVAVARAMACEPVLVLADEPTASLDADNAGVAMDLIQAVCAEHEAALLCVSHDRTMTDRFQRCAGLEELGGVAPSEASA